MLDEDPPPRPLNGAQPQFSAHVYCGQMAEWMKTPLGTEADLGPGHIMLDGDPASPPQKGTAAHRFSAHVYCGHGRPSQLLLSSCLSRPNGRLSSWIFLKFEIFYGR